MSPVNRFGFQDLISPKFRCDHIRCDRSDQQGENFSDYTVALFAQNNRQNSIFFLTFMFPL